ncbi:MAG: class I SAM-dependent methyltransferase [Methanomassiliicoccales archaeon]|nr:class I SAM-dependent methyltransferase [Methanomassiliicoccales archaeon]NYT15993.1 class I SAM-dependent methyltransferase [Methanomassiliicoccales archaeon]
MEGDDHPHFEPHETLDLPRQVIRVHDFYDGDGWILDIGGGGEGIIGLIMGRQVVSIDLIRRELAETSNDSLKVVMDATVLGFPDSTFDAVTAFFSLMYMMDDTLEAALKEASRVLKPGGEFLIWEPIVRPPGSSEKKVFISWLDVELPDGSLVETGYGHYLRRLEPDRIIPQAERSGLRLIDSRIEGSTFFLRMTKT